MTDLRTDVRWALADEAAGIHLDLTNAQVDSLVDAACGVFLERVAKAIGDLRTLLEPADFETVPLGVSDHCSPDTLLRYCDRMYPQQARQLLAAHADAWRRDRDELMLRSGG